MPRLSVYYIRAALLLLSAGITAGALMLANKGVPFEPALWRLLESHVEMMLIGWTIQLAAGVALWVLPRLPGPDKYGRMRLGWAAFFLLNGGVLAVALAQWLGLDALALAVAGRAAELLAFVLFAVQVWPRIRVLNLSPAQHATEETSP